MATQTKFATGMGDFVYKESENTGLSTASPWIEKVAISSIGVPSAVYSGQKNVTTAGTRVALATTQALSSGVTIKAKIGNTGSIYVGGSGVTNSNGYILAAGDTVFVEVNDLATVYLDSSVNGEGASFIAS